MDRLEEESELLCKYLKSNDLLFGFHILFVIRGRFDEFRNVGKAVFSLC